MGPGRAADIIREGLFRGADNGYLLTDRAFAGADTLATSYALGYCHPQNSVIATLSLVVVRLSTVTRRK